MDIRAQKSRLRAAVARRILALDRADRDGQEAALAARFSSLPGFEPAGSVLLYVTAFPEELATGPMLRQALALGKRLVCPRVDRSARRLRLYRVVDLEEDLRPGTLGIPEPRAGCAEVAAEEVDWVLVPGLAFDDRGFRLGRGAGYYDRLLPTLRPEAQRWALALDCQWVDTLPVEPHDMPIDGVVAPGRTVVRGRGPAKSSTSEG